MLVTSNRLRSPTLLAKMGATVDVIAGGRLILGLGAGGSALAAEHNPAVREFAAYGVPLVPPGQAVRELAQSLDIIRRMWASSEPFDYTGPTIQLTGAVCEPKPVQRPHPPVMIGGQGERLLRVVAEHADIWTYPGPPGAGFRQRDQVLREHCAAIGRDPAEITRSMQLIVRCDEPDAVPAARGQLLDRIEAGVTHLVIAALLGSRPVRWVADEIVFPVLAGRPVKGDGEVGGAPQASASGLRQPRPWSARWPRPRCPAATAAAAPPLVRLGPGRRRTGSPVRGRGRSASGPRSR